VFEDEADTITVAPTCGVDAFEATHVAPPPDTMRDDGELTMFAQEDDTDLAAVTERRAATDADWPPAPKHPARPRRRAQIYRAITSIP
jgi:hypothetical protein